MGFFMPGVFILFLAGLALVIIISAAFNYTSLSVARSLMRAREVGVRKTVGATRNQVIIQFLLEAVIVAMVSLVFAILLLQLILPGFTGMRMMSLLEIRPEQNITVYIWFFIFALVTGIIAGILPSIVISAFRPVNVLKGVVNIRFFSRITLRKILLVTQFIFAMIFIISILLLFRQINFMINAEMGFDRDIVYNLSLQRHDLNKVKNQYSTFPEIEYIAASSHIPGVGNIWGVDIRKNEEDEKYNGNYFYVDENYIQVMGLNIIAGTNFPENLGKGNEKFILVNEKTVEHFNLGTPLEALGSTFLLNDTILVEIIGVVKDYYYAALFMPLKPLLLRYKPESCGNLIFRIQSANMPMTVEKIKREWNKIDPYHEADGTFIDDYIREYYSFFEDVLYTVGFAAILAIVIAGFGLLGMATYSIQMRLKEIGIRKTLGAQADNILILVTRSYLWMMLIAAVIGAPLAYLINNMWLQFLAHRVTFGAGIIAIGILIVFLVGFITISTQSIRASSVNPARILKYE
ncbi:MAG: FtsX-like permease family protein, partial [Bacteroidales bacterium]